MTVIYNSRGRPVDQFKTNDAEKAIGEFYSKVYKQSTLPDGYDLTYEIKHDRENGSFFYARSSKKEEKYSLGIPMRLVEPVMFDIFVEGSDVYGFVVKQEDSTP